MAEGKHVDLGMQLNVGVDAGELRSHVAGND